MDARAAGGSFLLRIEDIDTPRVVPGAADTILRQLEQHGLTWDGPVTWQSRRRAAYDAAIARLFAAGALFCCTCSRASLAGGSGPYPGTCRHRRSPPAAPHALRVRVDDTPITFEDRLHGRCTERLSHTVGDFVVRRRDGIHAYQLAVVVDDAAAGITDVVRGSDLLDNTARQVYLQRLLSLPTPAYLHVPVIVDAAGDKLSKQTGARAIDGARAAENVRLVLACLGHAPPAGARSAGELLAWAAAHWQPARLPRTPGVAIAGAHIGTAATEPALRSPPVARR